jgi:amino acid adenylation domain-containing protein
MLLDCSSRIQSRIIPAAPTQTGIWIEQCIHPDSNHYNIGTLNIIKGPVDVGRFTEAVNWVFSHYEALYARVRVDTDNSISIVFDPANAVKCEVFDLTDEADPEASMKRLVHDRTSRPFRLQDNCQLVRPALIILGPRKVCYSGVYYHIIMDGWSVGLVIQHISKAYRDLKNGVTPASGDDSFSRHIVESSVLPDEAYRRKALAFWEPLLSQHVSEIKPVHKATDACGNATSELPRALTNKLTRIAETTGATLYHQLLLGWNILIEKTYGCGGRIGEIPILNRSREYRDTVGFFVETRVLPLPLDMNASVTENLVATSRRIRELFRYYRIPAGELTDLHRKICHLSQLSAPSAFSYVTKNYDADIEGNHPDLTIVTQDNQPQPFAIYAMDVYPDRDMLVSLVHQLAYMDAKEAALALGRYQKILEIMADNPAICPADIDMTTREEKTLTSKLLHQDLPLETQEYKPVIFNIVERMARHPDAIAVETGTQRRTYKELIGRASALARELRDHHCVTRGDSVGLLLPRSAELVEGELASMMLGATFVPMEIHNPEARLRQIVDDSRAKCIVTVTQFAKRASALHGEVVDVGSLTASDEVFEPLAKPDDVAYIIYTSGSTGRPKGVEITNNNLSAHLLSFDVVLQGTPLLNENERALFFDSPAFDASIESLYPILLCGGTIVMAPHPQWPAHEFASVIVNLRLTSLLIPPAYLAEFLKLVAEAPDSVRGHHVRLCICGGEAMHSVAAETWNRFIGPDSKLINIYGPTEITVASNGYIVPHDFVPEPGQSVPIGTMHEHYVGRIVDEHDRPVPIGIEGELLIGGPCVAKGYRNMPEATSKGFVRLEDGVRYYRSGDLVRMRPDGNLVFIRRNDSQVKIRGNRVELGEVESCIMTCPLVHQCAVLPIEDAGTNSAYLQAYVSLKDNATIGTSDLRTYVKSRLPDYMIPHFAILPSLPINDNGKIDRKALSQMITEEDTTTPEAPSESTLSPRNAVEEYIAVLWSESLGRKVNDVNADFFALGGHSILAARLIATVNKAFRTQYPFPYFFEKPTIESMAVRLGELTGSRERAEQIAALRIELSRMTPEEIRARLGKTSVEEASIKKDSVREEASGN